MGTQSHIKHESEGRASHQVARRSVLMCWKLYRDEQFLMEVGMAFHVAGVLQLKVPAILSPCAIKNVALDRFKCNLGYYDVDFNFLACFQLYDACSFSLVNLFMCVIVCCISATVLWRNKVSKFLTKHYPISGKFDPLSSSERTSKIGQQLAKYS